MRESEVIFIMKPLAMRMGLGMERGVLWRAGGTLTGRSEQPAGERGCPWRGAGPRAPARGAHFRVCRMQVSVGEAECGRHHRCVLGFKLSPVSWWCRRGPL